MPSMTAISKRHDGRRLTSLQAAPGVPQSVYDQLEGWQALSPAWIIDVVSWKWLAPIVEYLDELAGGYLGFDQVLGDVSYAISVADRIGHGDRGSKGQLSIHPDAQLL